MKVNRLDIGQLGSPEITSQGYLRIPAYATRTGIFHYKMPDGSVRKELRPPDEVFDHNSLKSLAEVPITNNHPPYMLDADNTKHFQVGFTGSNIDREGDYVRVKATITDGDTIKELKETKKRETSCGYTCDLEETSGVWNGEEFDAIQRSINYNHLAIVNKGRAGTGARLQMDRMDGVMVENAEAHNRNNANSEQGGNVMVKVTIDSIEYEASEGLAQAVRKVETEKAGLQKKLDEAESKNNELTGKVDALNGEIKKKNDEIEKVKKDMPTREQMVALAKARADLETFAQKHLEDGTKFDEMEDVDIKKAVIAKLNPDLKIDDKDESYVEGSFQIIKANHVDKNQNADQLKRNIGSGVGKVSVVDAEAIRRKVMDEDSKRWEQKTA